MATEKIEIAPYDPAWAVAFESERLQLAWRSDGRMGLAWICNLMAVSFEVRKSKISYSVSSASSVE